MSFDISWTNQFIETNDFFVVHVDLLPQDNRESQALLWLNSDERNRWNQYRYPRPRHEFALCRAALRSILCKRLNCRNEQLTFDTAEFGKPFALVDREPASISFNVSHSGQHGLIAVASHGRLGIDVEERAKGIDFEGIGTMVFGPRERIDLANAKREKKAEFFFMLWTHKEALIKALGTGFSLNPSKFEIPLAVLQGSGKSKFRFPHLPDIGWNIEDLSTGEFAATIAYESFSN